MQNSATSDTEEVYFVGATHQPLFVKNHKDTIDLGFTIESVIFKNAQGKDLNGWMLCPRNKKAAITLLHLHGNAGNLYSQHQLIESLVSRGYQIFMFDYSGYGFSEGKPTKETTLQDALSAIDYLKGRDDVKNTKLVLYGQSLGGHLSAVVAEKRQSDIDALVIEGAFSSRNDMAAYRARKVFLPGIVGRILVNQTYSAKSSIRRYHKPVLIIHSREDKEAPLKMGKTIFNNANEPKMFYEINGPHIWGVKLYADSIGDKIKVLVSK